MTTHFDIVLDIFISSGLVTWIDFEEETEQTKGQILFVTEGRKFEIIFNKDKFESFREVS